MLFCFQQTPFSRKKMETRKIWTTRCKAAHHKPHPRCHAHHPFIYLTSKAGWHITFET